MSKLEVKDLTLIYGSNIRQAQALLEKGISKEEIQQKTKCVVAVNKVSFTINDGEIFVIMGLSGSGKSSLLRCLNLLNVPTSGSIMIGDQDITTMDHKTLLNLRRQIIGMVFQHFALLPHKTILENVAFGLEIQNIPLEKRNQKAQKVIEMVGLQGYESSYPKQLSGGMQQRVGIARAIATDSEILLMDEAFSALDPLIRTQMQDELIEIQQKLKKTIVFITHDLDEALKLGDTIAIMKDGVIVQQDNAENILLNPADDYVRSFIDDVDSAKVISAAGLMKPFKERIHIERDGPATAVRRMERFNHYFLPVVGQNNQFLGYIRIKDARRLVDARKKDVSSILIDVPTIQSDMLLVDTLPLFAEQNYPLAVVDVKNRPLGYLRYTSVVEMISGNGYDPDTKSISDNNSQTSTKQEQQTGESITTAEKE